MAESDELSFFDDKTKTTRLALILGVLGSVLMAIGFGVDWVVLQVVGAVVLGSSGLVWAIQGMREDK